MLAVDGELARLDLGLADEELALPGVIRSWRGASMTRA